VNSELERISKGAVVAEVWNYPSIFSERLRKTTRTSVPQPIVKLSTSQMRVNNVTAGIISRVSMPVSNYKTEIINTGESVIKYLKDCTDIYTGTLKKTAIDLGTSSRLDPCTNKLRTCWKRARTNNGDIACVSSHCTKLAI
jgi:hypothetical protein